MCKIALFIAAATIATPALAHDRYAPPPRDDLREASRALSDPRAQASVASLVDALTDAVMQTHVGPLAVLSNDPDVRPSDTLADVEHRRDPYYRARLRGETAGAMALLGQVAGDAARMSDEYRATAARVEHVIEPYRR